MGFFSEEKRKMNGKLGVLVLATMVLSSVIFGGMIGDVVYADKYSEGITTEKECKKYGNYEWSLNKSTNKWRCINKAELNCNTISGNIWVPGDKVGEGRCKTREESQEEEIKNAEKIRLEKAKAECEGKKDMVWYKNNCMTKKEYKDAKRRDNEAEWEKKENEKDLDCKDGIKTALFGCVRDDKQGGPVFKLLGLIVKILTFGVGSLAVFGLVFSGLQYASARDNEAQVKKAKDRIMNIVIGLVIYAVMYAVVSWLIPGGL